MTPRRPGESGSGGANLATYLALVGLLFMAAGLMALFAMVLNVAVFWLFCVLFGFVLVGTLHYVVWGRWLSNLPIDDEDEEA